MKKDKKISKPLLVLLFLVVFYSFYVFFVKNDDNVSKVSYSQLITQIDNNKIKSIEWNPNSYEVTVQPKNKKENSFVVAVPTVKDGQGLDLIMRKAESKNIDFSSVRIQAESSPVLRVLSLVPTFLMIIIVIFLVKTMMGGAGSSSNEPVISDITYDDIAGVDEAVEELKDVRSFLKNPERYKTLGANVPKGVLLYGPPGTGKTLLAKAVAHETGCNFYQTSGSEFIEMFAGLGARRVRNLFKVAKENGPSIIFIDELDAVGGKRNSMGGGDGASREGDQTLLQILKEMDGFEHAPKRKGFFSKKEVVREPVIVMGATNRKDSLDSALLRPGRFDRHIAIDPPDRKGRLQILKVHSKNKPFNNDVNLEEMAVHSAGFSGADLALWLNEAALLAARHNKTVITKEDVDNAYFRILAGPQKQNRLMSDQEREHVAYHESGHALVGEYLDTKEKVHKISIIPRGQSGGQTISVSEEDIFLYNEQNLRDMIARLLAGRAAEELKFNIKTSGAHDDLKRATHLAQKMTLELGMSEGLGLRVIPDNQPISAHLEEKIEEEIQKILKEEYARAQQILQTHEKELEAVSKELLEKETLDRDSFIKLI